MKSLKLGLAIAAAVAVIPVAIWVAKPQWFTAMYSSIESRIERDEEEKVRRFDQPGEAAEFAAMKRRPVGSDKVPMDRYFAAWNRLGSMPAYTSGTGQSFQPSDLRDVNAPSLSTWTSLGPGNIGGRTRAIVIDRNNVNVMYLGGVAGGVWKTTNGGASWLPIGDILPNLAVTSMAMDPANSNVLYAGTGEGVFSLDAAQGAGIFKTNDAGASWTPLAQTSASADFYYVNKIVVSPVNNNRVYAATRSGVWRSTDGGGSWTRVLTPAVANGCLDMVIRTDKTTDYLFAACGTFEQGRIYRNTDAAGAGAWTEVYTEANMARTSLALSPSNQNIIYALAASKQSGSYNNGLLAVIRSVASGDPLSWADRVRNTNGVLLNTLLLSNPSYPVCPTTVGNANQGWYDNVIAVDPANPDIVWAGGIDLFRSNDGGQNWGIASHWRTTAHADQHVILFHPQYDGTTNQTLYVGNDGGIFRTTVARASVGFGTQAPCTPSSSSVVWTNLNNGLGITQFYHGLPYPGGATFFGGTQDNGTVRGTTGGGASWARIQGGDGGYVAVDPGNTNIVYAEYYGFSIQKSINGGSSWANAISGINDPAGLFIVPFTMDPNNSQRLWTGGRFIWRTTNGAASWTQASAAINGSVSAVAVATGNSEIVAAGTNTGNIYVTQSSSATNSGTNWPVAQPRAGYVSSIAFDPSSANTIYATYASFNAVPTDRHVYRSTNSGGSWTAIDGSGATGIPDIPVHSIVVDPQSPLRLFAGSDLGVFVTEDGGATWNREIAGFAPAITESLALQNVGGTFSLYAFTHGRGAWRTTVSSPSACTYILTPNNQTVGDVASSGSFAVTVASGCARTATSNAQWIILTGTTTGTGSGTVNYNVLANTGAARQGTITVGSGGVFSTFTINQAGVIGGSNDEIGGATLVSALPATLSQNSTTATANAADPLHSCTGTRDSRTLWFRYVAGFTGVLAVNTAGSAYDTVLTAYQGTTSVGSELACNDDTGGTLQSAMTFNVTSGQSYLVEVSGYGASNAGGPLTLTFSQAGSCPVTIAPPSATFGSAGGTDSISVTAPGCGWSAVSNANWITILSGATGTGNGTVQYLVAADPSGTGRTSSIAIGSQTFIIAQVPTCSYTLSATSQSFTSAAGTGSLTVATPGPCSWNAISNDAWITITSQPLSTGNGTVTYSVTANTGIPPRTGTMTIAGQTYTVSQAGTGLANDEFVTATLISSLPFTTSQSTTAATANVTDPVHSAPPSCTGLKDSRTVWFRFVPNVSGAVKIDTFGSNYDTVLSAYQTSVGAGNEIACNDDFNGSLTSQISFAFTAGVTYYVEVSAFDFSLGGTLLFRASNVTNDEVTGATPVPSLPFVTTQNVQSATTVPGDPLHTCTGSADGSTVWFRYVATFTGIVNVNTFGSDYDSVLAVYPANSPGSEMGCDDDALNALQSQLSFSVTSGNAYLIEVSSYIGSPSGTLVLSAVRLMNDDVAGATQLASLPSSTTEDVRAATTTGVEPAPSCTGGGFHTVWFRHVAGFSGVAEFRTANSDYDTILAVYSGNPALNTEVACNDDSDQTLQSRVSLSLIAGNTYYIGVSAFDSALGFTGSLLLNSQTSGTQLAALSSPAPGTTLAGASVPFTWSQGTGVSAYRLTLGSSLGATDIYNGAQTALLTATVVGIPTDGRTIHARLYSLVGLTWLFADYNYQAAVVGCTYAINPASVSRPSTAGNGSVSVIAPAGCTWTAVSNAPAWLTVTLGNAGTGNGTVNYALTPNTGSQRTGIITIAGQEFRVAQEAASSAGLQFVPVTPCRISDTRNANGPLGGPIMGGTTTRDFPVPSSACGIPANAAAYSMNVTVVPQGGLAFLTLWPAGQTRPTASTLNSLDGRIKANAAIVPAGTGGAVSVYVTNPSDVILDINGYFIQPQLNSLVFYSLPPCRVMDTRNPAGSLGGPSLAAVTARSFPIRSSNCGIPATARAYSFNTTVVPQGSLGFLSMWPAGTSQPLVSTLNALTGTVVANAAIVPAGSDSAGSVNLFSTQQSDVIIDINGYFAPPGQPNGLSFFAVNPCRVLDSRVNNGSPLAPLATNLYAVPSLGDCGVPSTAQSFSVNVTAVPPAPLAFISMWPDLSGVPQPTVSTLNALDGAITSNAAIVPGGTAGRIKVLATNLTHLIIDINGYFAP